MRLSRDAVVHKSLCGQRELLDGHDEYRAERRLSDRRSTRHVIDCARRASAPRCSTPVCADTIGEVADIAADGGDRIGSDAALCWPSSVTLVYICELSFKPAISQLFRRSRRGCNRLELRPVAAARRMGEQMARLRAARSQA
jgi:hypothetical protein